MQPKTLTEAVDAAIEMIPEDQREDVANQGLFYNDLHMGLGLRIRNEFGLHGENQELLKELGDVPPDEASEKILNVVIMRLSLPDIVEDIRGNTR